MNLQAPSPPEESLPAHTLSGLQLVTMLERIADGITIQTPQGQLQYANDHAAKLIGYPSAAALLRAPILEVMQGFELMDEAGAPLPLANLPGRKAMLEGRVHEAVLRFRVRATGEEHWSLVNATPIIDEFGVVQAVVNVFHDITATKQAQEEIAQALAREQAAHAATDAALAEAERARERQGFLAEASLLLTRSLDYETTLTTITQLLVPKLADWCTVYLRRADGGIQQLVGTHVDPQKLDLIERVATQYPPDLNAPYGLPHVFKSGEAEFRPEISATLLKAAARDEEHLRLLEALRLSSAILVPLKARGEVLGAISMVMADSGRHYGQEDLVMAQELAHRAALAIDNVRLYREANRQRQQLQMTLASIADAVITTDVDGLVNFMNPIAEAMTGWPVEAALGLPLGQVFQVVDEQTGRPITLRPLPSDDGRGVEGERNLMLHARDGRRWPIEESATPLRDEAGYISGMVIAFRDTSERRQAEAAQREHAEIVETVNRVGQALAAELDLERLLQAVTDAATGLVHAEFGAFFYNVVNPQGESYTLYTISGVPRAAFERFPLPRNTHLFGPTFRGEGVIRIANVREDTRYGKNSPYFGMPEGHLPVTSYLAIPVISRSGEVLGGLFFGHSQAGVFREREERLLLGIAAQTAIAIDNARLFQSVQAAIQLRDQFLSIASHELKTPLTTLQGYADLLQRRIVTGRDKHQSNLGAVQAIAYQARRINRLIESMLDLSHIQAGTLHTNLAPLDLGQMVSEQIAVMRPIMDHHPLVFVAPQEPVMVVADTLRLEQVLYNLIDNAAKYSPVGSPITVRLQADAGEAVLMISDQGIGIPPEAQARLFDRFFRASNVVGQAASGLGLGLYVVHQIVTLHGGTITVESREGEGSTFIIRLPLLGRGAP